MAGAGHVSDRRRCGPQKGIRRPRSEGGCPRNSCAACRSGVCAPSPPGPPETPRRIRESWLGQRGRIGAVWLPRAPEPRGAAATQQGRGSWLRYWGPKGPGAGIRFWPRALVEWDLDKGGIRDRPVAVWHRPWGERIEKKCIAKDMGREGVDGPCTGSALELPCGRNWRSAAGRLFSVIGSTVMQSIGIWDSKACHGKVGDPGPDVAERFRVPGSSPFCYLE